MNLTKNSKIGYHYYDMLELTFKKDDTQNYNFVEKLESKLNEKLIYNFNHSVITDIINLSIGVVEENNKIIEAFIFGPSYYENKKILIFKVKIISNDKKLTLNIEEVSIDKTVDFYYRTERHFELIQNYIKNENNSNISEILKEIKNEYKEKNEIHKNKLDKFLIKKAIENIILNVEKDFHEIH